MKNLIQFLNEAKTFDANTKVSMGDSAALLKFLKDDIENLDGTIKVTGDGIKYNNILIPGTKLSARMTAGEYADILVSYINDQNEKQENSSKKLIVKKPRKNAGVPRGNYGAKEKMDARAEKRNQEIIHSN